MYCGTVSVREKSYRTEYRPPFGDVSVFAGWVETPHEHYRCEHCGRDHRVIGRAPEPFFCGNPDCGRLVGIDSEGRS